MHTKLHDSRQALSASELSTSLSSSTLTVSLAAGASLNTADASTPSLPRSSNGLGGTCPLTCQDAVLVGQGAGTARPLVNTHKSHRYSSPVSSEATTGKASCHKTKVLGFNVWRSSLRIIKDFQSKGQVGGGLRGEIDSFSSASKRRLRHVAANCFPELITQFCLTYHGTFKQGDEVKKDLDKFLKCMRRTYPGFKYLWILEFQTRGFPHFHLFFNVRHDTPGLLKYIGETWSRIAEPESEQHLKFHSDPRNLIPWDMGTGSYLTKYLDKEHQKIVPEMYENVGRFWGASKGLVPPPTTYEIGEFTERFDKMEMNRETGEIYCKVETENFLMRAIKNYHQSKLSRYKKKSRVMTAATSFMVAGAAPIFLQIYGYLAQNHVPF